MNVSEFTSLLKQPGNTSEEHLHSLKKIAKEYPYFQAVWALYLKTLKQQDSFEYNTALKHTAAYTTDRSILFDFITSETFLQHKTAEHINKRIFDINAIKVNAEELIVETINKEENEAILNPELFLPRPPDTKTEETPAEKTPPERKTPEKQLQMGKPLSFNTDELHSFTAWLKLSSLTPIDRNKPSGNASKIKEKRKEKFKIIDKFITQNPKISPQKEAEPSPGLPIVEEVEKTDLMTETLARVYLEQKRFKKAIQAYKILSLKYPEKSSFFADQIKAIKKLQKNNN